ncbi:MAG: hypothetical protein IKQ45_05075 [Clostridia bacterium]|nr:hypothetical protein [Clostridia bacterium]
MTLYNWLTLLGIPGMLAAMAAFVRVQLRQNRAVKDGLRAILRDRLLQSFQFCNRQGFADSDDRQNFENMYVQYHSLGGNGVMDDVRRKFFALPINHD